MVGFIVHDREMGELLTPEVWDSMFLVLPRQEEIHTQRSHSELSHGVFGMCGGKGLTLLTH